MAHRRRRGTAAAPIRVRRLIFHGGRLGVVVQGDSGQPVEHVIVKESRFEGPGYHVQLLQAVRNVDVRRNVAVGGMGVLLNLELPGQSSGVRVVDNAFFRPAAWLHPASSLAEAGHVLVAGNVVVESDAIDVPPSDPAPTLGGLAQSGAWTFRDNRWEPSAAANEPERSGPRRWRESSPHAVPVA